LPPAPIILFNFRFFLTRKPLFFPELLLEFSSKFNQVLLFCFYQELDFSWLYFLQQRFCADFAKHFVALFGEITF